jgi:rubredoxin/uncharacterized membrane protein
MPLSYGTCGEFWIPSIHHDHLISRKKAGSNSMKDWKCSVCGYIHKGETPPPKCPVCGSDKSKFDLPGETAVPEAPAKPMHAAPLTGPSSSAILKWKCTVCGYIHSGPEPPEKCPVCGADKSKFIPLEEEQPIAPDAVKATKSKEAGSDLEEVAGRFATYLNHPLTKMLTRLHAHPIAVHIPNGVLPLTVLFTILAALFQSDSMAVAAKYNMIFVFLSTPVVILTGFIDWHIRFNAQMSQVFKIKMMCAGIVSLLSLILSIWWIADPQIYLGGASNLSLFLLINIMDLAAAAVAGWHGGKLVFPNS